MPNRREKKNNFYIILQEKLEIFNKLNGASELLKDIIIKNRNCAQKLILSDYIIRKLYDNFKNSRNNNRSLFKKNNFDNSE